MQVRSNKTIPVRLGHCNLQCIRRACDGMMTQRDGGQAKRLRRIEQDRLKKAHAPVGGGSPSLPPTLLAWRQICRTRYLWDAWTAWISVGGRLGRFTSYCGTEREATRLQSTPRSVACKRLESVLWESIEFL